MMILRLLLLCCTYVCIQAQRLGIYTLAGKNHTALQGRVEIRINGTSGTVCDDKFDNNAATVVCRVLNHNNGGIAVLDHRFGPGTGPIWLDDLVCQGNEQYLNQCQTNSKYLNASNCNHKEDVGVICNIDSRSMQISNSSITSQIIQQPSNCPNYRTNLDVRLIGPLNLIGIGYVEIKHNGVWGSICDDLWSLNDAKVICRMLCFELYCVQAGGPKEMIAGINQVSTNYLLDDVECTGNELDIRDCKRLDWSIHNCRPEHQEFASVTCIPLKNERPPVPVPTMECTNGTFNVQFSRYQDRFLLTEHLSVKNNSRLCTLTKAINSSTVSIIIPFTEECGSHASGNATHIFYTNQVGYKYTMVQLHVIRDNTYWIDVTCIFARNLEVSKGFTPITDAFTKTAFGRFFITMSFYRQQGPCNDTCFIELLDPVRLYVGEWLNVAVSLTSFVQDDLKLIVPMCRATPTYNRYDAISASLFSNKCQVEPTLGFYPLNSTSFGFRYRAFRFDTTDSVYIHCDAFVCLKSEKHNIDDCDRTCNSTRINRGKREASREIFHLVSKPIKILRRKDKMDGQTNELESHLTQSVTLSTSADMTSARPFTSLLSSRKVIDGTTSNFKTVTSTSSITSPIIKTNLKSTLKQEGSENGFAHITSTASREFDKSKTTFHPTLKLSEHNQRDTTIIATTESVENVNTKRKTTSSTAMLFDAMNGKLSTSQSQKRRSKSKSEKILPDSNQLYAGGLGGKLTILSGGAYPKSSYILVFCLMMFSLFDLFIV
ncbi:uncharacterized protein [Mytilus edulis]|uniref:uncharacterized protein n=1 Tax=Mytilus edulis TaxID=6550 RepID=UPI0039EF340A